jgi:hypothetical protein
MIDSFPPTWSHFSRPKPQARPLGRNIPPA